jgi:hypothetical protein
VHRLLKWAEENDEEVGDIARCGGYFDLETPGLKDERPRRWQFILAVPFIAICACALVFAGGFSLSGRAWVSVKNGSGTQLLLSTTNIEVHKTHQYFSKDDCTGQDHATIAKQVGIPANEVDVACGWLKDDASLKAEIKQTVHQQRGAAAALAIIAVCYGMPPYRWFISAVAATAMRERLGKTKKKSRAGSRTPRAGRVKSDGNKSIPMVADE